MTICYCEYEKKPDENLRRPIFFAEKIWQMVWELIKRTGRQKLLVHGPETPPPRTGRGWFGVALLLIASFKDKRGGPQKNYVEKRTRYMFTT
jgi:hypothetical protein